MGEAVNRVPFDPPNAGGKTEPVLSSEEVVASALDFFSRGARAAVNTIAREKPKLPDLRRAALEAISELEVLFRDEAGLDLPKTAMSLASLLGYVVAFTVHQNNVNRKKP